LRGVSQSIRAISPVLATLILIIVAIAAGIFVWAWLSGWISLQMTGMGEDLAITRVSVSRGYLQVYVRNKGSVKSTIVRASVDDLPPQDVRVSINQGEEKVVRIAYAWTYKSQYKVKLWTERGLQIGGTYPVASPETPYCLKFDGVDDYALLPVPMRGFPSGSLTLEAWVKGYGVVFDEQGDGAPSSTWHDAQIEVLSDGTVKMSVWPYTVVLDCGKIDTSTWTHLALTYDADTGELRGYVNGQLKDSGNMVRNPGDGMTYVIGYGDSTNLGEGHFFSGLIDEVRIYNRALSGDEILSNYRGSVSTNGLVCWLRLDRTWYDSSDYDNDLSDVSGATWYEPGVTHEALSGLVALSALPPVTFALPTRP